MTYSKTANYAESLLPRYEERDAPGSQRASHLWVVWLGPLLELHLSHDLHRLQKVAASFAAAS